MVTLSGLKICHNGLIPCVRFVEKTLTWKVDRVVWILAASDTVGPPFTVDAKLI